MSDGRSSRAAATTSCSTSGARLLRVQCKWATCARARRRREPRSVPATPRGYVRTTYDAVRDRRDRGLLPASSSAATGCRSETRGRASADHLRLEPAGNNQEAAINFAADYELGAIAQLGERRLAARRSGVRVPLAPLRGRSLGGLVVRGPARLLADGALRRLAPELLEPVELARLRREDVDDDVEVVHEDPARLGEALDPPRQQRRARSSARGGCRRGSPWPGGRCCRSR